MGLGKTVQVCAYLQSIADRGLLDSCLIVVPNSVVPVWQNAFREWTSMTIFGCCFAGLPVILFHSVSPKGKKEIQDKVHNAFSVVLTTYGTLDRNVEYFSAFWTDTDQASWDYVVLDEGHKVIPCSSWTESQIKNSKSENSQCLKDIPSKHRIMLTGTPLQNNLLEMWNIMDWLCNHQLLGERSAFDHVFRKPIERGNDKRATQDIRDYGDMMAKQLHDEIFKVTLRREKSAVFRDSSIPAISKKTEIVLWW